MRFEEFLNESQASDEAKKKGLVSAGWGKWKDKSGKVVAQTVDGKLQPVKSGGSGTSGDSNRKPALAHLDKFGLKPREDRFDRINGTTTVRFKVTDKRADKIDEIMKALKSAGWKPYPRDGDGVYLQSPDKSEKADFFSGKDVKQVMFSDKNSRGFK